MNFTTSKSKIIIFSVIGLIFLVSILILFFGRKPLPKQVPPVSLTFWGMYDDSEIMDYFTKNYKFAKEKVSIKYFKKTPQEYEKAILEGLSSGKGPDIIMIHNTGLFKNKEILEPMPPCMAYFSLMYRKYMGDENIPPIPKGTYNNECDNAKPDFKNELYKNIRKVFKNNFVDVAFDDFVLDGKVYALPLYVDTLALFYNKDHFNASTMPYPPKTWEEFVEAVKRLRRIKIDGQIERAGVALGDTKTIHRATDILALLMMQKGAEMVDLAKKKVSFTSSQVSPSGTTIQAGVDALKFYTSFSNPLAADIYTWNNRQNYSIDAFVRGEVSMIFDYSFIINDIKSKNANLNFGIVSMPQLESDPDKKINYADYYGVAVTKNVLDKTSRGNLICGYRCKTAWEFLIYLTNKNNAKIYLEKAFRPTARRDLIDFQGNDPELGVFANQSLTAKSWKQPDKALVEQILIEALDDNLRGNKGAFEVLKRAEDRIRVLIRSK